MSRLEEECIMAVVRNRSGMDSGEIDYNLMTDKFEQMSIGCLKDALITLGVLADKCRERIKVLETNPKAGFFDKAVVCSHDPGEL